MSAIQWLAPTFVHSHAAPARRFSRLSCATQHFFDGAIVENHEGLQCWSDASASCRHRTIPPALCGGEWP
jgi:hypothetical protein